MGVITQATLTARIEELTREQQKAQAEQQRAQQQVERSEQQVVAMQGAILLATELLDTLNGTPAVEAVEIP